MGTYQNSNTLWAKLIQRITRTHTLMLLTIVALALALAGCGGGDVGGGGTPADGDGDGTAAQVLELRPSQEDMGVLTLNTVNEIPLYTTGGQAPFVFLAVNNPYEGKIDINMKRGTNILTLQTYDESQYVDDDFAREYTLPVLVQDSTGTFVTIEVKARLASSASTGGCTNIVPEVTIPATPTISDDGILNLTWEAKGVKGVGCDLTDATWSYTTNNTGYVLTGLASGGPREDGTGKQIDPNDSKITKGTLTTAGQTYKSYTKIPIRRGLTKIYITLTPKANAGAEPVKINSREVFVNHNPSGGEGDDGGSGGDSGEVAYKLRGGTINAGTLSKGEDILVDLNPIGGKLPYTFQNSISTNILYGNQLKIVAVGTSTDVREYTDAVKVTDANGDVVFINVKYVEDNQPPFIADTGACENLAPTLTQWMLNQVDKDGKVTLEWNSYYVKFCDLTQGSWTYTIENVNYPGGKKTFPSNAPITTPGSNDVGVPYKGSTVITLPEGNSKLYVTVIPKGATNGVRSDTFSLVFGKADDLFTEVDAKSEVWRADPDSQNWPAGALSNPQFDPGSVSANFKRHITKTQFETMFPRRWGSAKWDALNTGAVPHQADEPDFFSYDNFVKALDDMARLKLVVRRREGTNLQEVIRLDKASGKQMTVKIDGDFYASWNSKKTIISEYVDFGAFANEGTGDQQRREIAAFFANIGHETTGGGGGWNAQDGSHTWALFFREEVAWAFWKPGDPVGYVQEAHPDYPGTPGQSYHGRGPIQLSWNYNYGYMSALVYGNISTLLDDPGKITRNGTLAFDTGIWFWMTPQAPKPSAHSIIAGTWDYTTEPVATSNNILDGFGATVNVINGGLEAGPHYAREIKINNGVLIDGKSGQTLTAFYLAKLDANGIEDRSSSQSVAVNLGLDSIKQIKVLDDKLQLTVDGVGAVTVSAAGDYKLSGGGLKGGGYILKFRIKPGSNVEVSDYTDITFDGSLSELKALSNAQLGTSSKFSEFVKLYPTGTHYIVVEDYRVHDRINFYDYFVRTLTGNGSLLGHQIGAKNQKSFF